MKTNYREMTRASLIREMNKIISNYMTIYDEYYQTYSRDSAFLKDLVDGLEGISAVLEVYVSYQGINSDYAIEKLTFFKNIIKHTIEYFETRDK